MFQISRICAGLLLLILCGNAFGIDKDKKKDKENSLDAKPAPPMGWNSWDCLGFEITEEQVIQVADYMAEHLKDFGWEYLVVDLGWYYSPEVKTTMADVYQPSQSLDAYGRLIPNTDKFPSAKNGQGFKYLADYVHSKGLKFGIHIMRGIPWNAVDQDLPIKDSKYTAKQIFNFADTCKWNSSMYGVNTDIPGGIDYYNSIVDLYSSWGVDFIKADNMLSPINKKEIKTLSEAINAAERSMMLSLSPGPAQTRDHEFLDANANMWRVSNDFWDHWDFVLKQIDLYRNWKKYDIKVGHPDLDMLPFGKLRITGGDDWVASLIKDTSGNIGNEYSRFSEEEKKTVMSVWCMFASPLFMGGYLPENDHHTLGLLTNDEVIQVNKTAYNQKEVKHNESFSVWTSNIKGEEGKYLAVINTDAENKTLVLNTNRFWKEKNGVVRDLWGKKNIGDLEKTLSITVPPHGTALYKISAK